MVDSIKVLVVDDSAYNRRTIIKMLEDIPGIAVVGYACDGEEGLRKLFDLKPDLITLDLEMPRMDGFTFLRLAMQNFPVPVLVVSARSEDENVFKALELGALDFVAKPTARITPELFNMREDLLRKVRGICRADMKKILRRAASAPVIAGEKVYPVVPPAATRLEKRRISHVVIGASTGGPPALQGILSAIKRPLPVGMAISQHMPPGFTRAFAERLNKFSAMEVREARTGDLLSPGRVLIAPGGRNLLVQKRGEEFVAEVVDPQPEQRYIPSVDDLFASAAEAVGPKVLGVVLTGMGNDGARGVIRVKMRGGQVLAEAEESSVVFGMPKEAIATGCVDQVLPLSQIGDEIVQRSLG